MLIKIQFQSEITRSNKLAIDNFKSLTFVLSFRRYIQILGLKCFHYYCLNKHKLFSYYIISKSRFYSS